MNLLEFERFAIENRKKSGSAKPETFKFLGFTHISAKSTAGKFIIRRLIVKKRMKDELQLVNAEHCRRMYYKIADMGNSLHQYLMVTISIKGIRELDGYRTI